MNQAQKNQIILPGRNNFPYFTNNIFSHSKTVMKQGNFVGGQYVDDTALFLQNNNKTARISARDHFKSFSFYDHFLWQVLRHVGKDLEAHYFSFNAKMLKSPWFGAPGAIGGAFFTS